jgi:hypothetical protein
MFELAGVLTHMFHLNNSTDELLRHVHRRPVVSMRFLNATVPYLPSHYLQHLSVPVKKFG